MKSKDGRNVRETRSDPHVRRGSGVASHQRAVRFIPTIRITLAGNVIEEVDGRQHATDALGPRGRVVLDGLVLERHRLTPVGELAEATWGMDLPDTWRPALRGILTRLRRFLEIPRPDATITLDNRLGCYQLALPANAEVDVEQAV